MKLSHQATVLRSAAASRLLLLFLIILWRSLVSPYDTSAPLNPNCIASSSNSSQPVLLPSLASAIEGTVVWDAVYFVRIAQCGYEYEQTYAFLPLLPICISLLSRSVFAPLVPLIGHRAVLSLSGYVINNIAFVLAAIYFYRLSVLILKDSDAALRASILFCFNPASIFYSSIYTESLYALFSIGGIYHLMSSSRNTAVLWLALSGCARSNGVLNAGYFGFQAMHRAYDAAFMKRRVFMAAWILIVGALRCICVFIPFIAFQAYGYKNLCLGRSEDEMRPWCKAKVPLLYNFIQSHYWGVGFLKYFQFKQLPNFLLASPILSLALRSIVHYVKLRPKIAFSLGFQASVEEKKSEAVLFSLGDASKSSSFHSSKKSSSKIQGNQDLRQRKQVSKEVNHDAPSIENESSTKLGYLSASVLPFILHLSFMVATAFFVMHVQVATRFLSASPSLYWFSSYLMTSPSIPKRWVYLIWAYSSAYILLGSLLFSNFYPFT